MYLGSIFLVWFEFDLYPEPDMDSEQKDLNFSIFVHAIVSKLQIEVCFNKFCFVDNLYYITK